MVFGSQFPVAQEALVERVEQVGLRMVLGRTVMTTGPAAAAALVTSEDRAVELVREEIERWHPLADAGRGDARVQIAIVPRFALSVTTGTLAALGELWHEYRDCGVYVTTHISENGGPGDGEVADVRARFGVEDYLDVYDGRFLPGSRVGGPTLLGRRTVLAHAVHCSDGEFARMAEAGTSIAHCPVSQQFLGSGTLPWRRAAAGGMTIAIGSDIAAGDEWFIPRVLNACFKAHMNEAGDDAVVAHARAAALPRHAGRCPGAGPRGPHRQPRRGQGRRLRRDRSGPMPGARGGPRGAGAARRPGRGARCPAVRAADGGSRVGGRRDVRAWPSAGFRRGPPSRGCDHG